MKLKVHQVGGHKLQLALKKASMSKNLRNKKVEVGFFPNAIYPNKYRTHVATVANILNETEGYKFFDYASKIAIPHEIRKTIKYHFKQNPFLNVDILPKLGEQMQSTIRKVISGKTAFKAITSRPITIKIKQSKGSNGRAVRSLIDTGYMLQSVKYKVVL